MKNGKKQLHIRLDTDLYKKLKVKCAYENTSVQDSVGKVIESLVKYPLIQPKNRDETEKLEILALLQQCSILFDLDKYELESLAGAAVIHHFNKGMVIDQEGEISTSFHIIKNGIVKVFKTAPTGKEFIIDVRCEGEVFGEASVLKAVPHCASTKALQNTEVVDIRRRDFLDLMARNPAIAQKIADLEFDKIQRLYESLIDLVASNTHQRLIKLLHRLGHKYGNTLRFTHQEIAEMSGTTAETVTRVLTQLRRSSILRLTRGSVIIIDKEKLKSLAS
jgi:CRP/FNR family cyclic AMP-dependent transcriptional regulator